MLVSLLLPSQYSATASVVIDAKSADPISGIQTQAMMLPAYMATQIDIINSDRVALRVIKLLKLDQVPEFRQKWEKDTEGRGSFDKWLADMIGKKARRQACSRK